MGVMDQKIKQEISQQMSNISVLGPLRRLKGHGLDIIFPPQPLWPTLKGPLSANLHFIDRPQCEACGFPFPYDMGAGVLCGNCTVRMPQFDRARAAFIYDVISRQPILSLKHGGQTQGLAIFAQQLKRAGRELFIGADRLMPVPLHPSRLRKRRFNQAALLARALSRLVKIPADANSLMRKKATSSQGGKTASARRRNMQGAFQVPTGKLSHVQGQNIILIDDVMTTGATVESCARTLKRAGAGRVDVLTLARVVKDMAQDGLVIDTIS